MSLNQERYLLTEDNYFIINNIFCKIIKQASLKEATSKFPSKLLGHCKNFMGHWVRPEKKMFWNNSYSRLPIIGVIWNFCHLFYLTLIPPPQPCYYFMKFTRKKRKFPGKSQKILWYHFITTPPKYCVCFTVQPLIYSTLYNLTHKSTVFQFSLYIKMLIQFEIRNKLNLLSFETRLKF